jgi:hypothetical protein
MLFLFIVIQLVLKEKINVRSRKSALSLQKKHLINPKFQKQKKPAYNPTLIFNFKLQTQKEQIQAKPKFYRSKSFLISLTASFTCSLILLKVSMISFFLPSAFVQAST